MLKVMTMNLNYYVTKHGAWETRREMIAEVIRANRPDVIAFQAVRQDPAVAGGKDQARQLQDSLDGYASLIFQPAMEYPAAIREGSAILSRLRIAASDHLKLTLLPGLDDPNRRVVVHARFDLPGGAFHLFNGHFSWVTAQTDVTLDEVLPYTNAFDGLGLLVGDLNTPSDSHLLQRIRQSGWTDVWDQMAPGEPGFTFESSSPSLRIDYAWANAALAPRVESIQIVANRPHPGGEYASDHFGLLVALDVEPG